MTIIKNQNSLGGLGSKNYVGAQQSVIDALAMTIEATNSNVVKDAGTLYNFIKARTKEVERINGQPIPIEYANVFFTQGGLQSGATGFDITTENFTIKKGIPFHVEIFNRTDQDILDARNAKIDLMNLDLIATKRVARTYLNRYLPNIALLPFLTGTSLSKKIPTMATDNESFGRSFGWVRGDDVSDFLPATQNITTANHYRGLIGNAISLADITSLADLIESYSDYSQEGIVGIIHPRLLANLGTIYTSATNVDSHVINEEGLKNFLGIQWLECSQMSQEFIILLDKGKTDLVVKGINPDPEQRGFALVDMLDSPTFKYDDGLKGVKAVIFEEEYMIASRFSGGILDVARKGVASTTSDKAVGMSTAGVTALELFASNLEKMYAIAK